MADKAGDTVVKTVLRSGDADMQRLAAQEFMVRELAEARAARQTTPVLSATPRVTPLKIEVSKYGGDERTPLRRWFCEIDEAISTRQISDAQQQVIFAMSMLTGKGRSWAFGSLQNTFEPPQSEIRLRAEFLSVKQGVMDLHECAMVEHHRSGPSTPAACFKSATSSGSSSLITLSLQVVGMRSPITALLDSGATSAAWRENARHTRRNQRDRLF
ncbi:TPA: hypothetical protein N0F65_008260 [Lagenidium giganteum]|uniref:Retrotransposon gag domain-containing protein n=1 Tax=Lagenidium giganteum TaxID=4803 RepID=A0AAV2YLL1_9STRA|nr:TPA: hypothetical protein N0F65_008260 [Lagenidium giganteum]